MKFGKLLKAYAAEEMSDHSNMILRYKELKKQLKTADGDFGEPTLAAEGREVAQPSGREPEGVQSPARTEAPGRSAEGSQALTAEERAFLQTLREDLEKFNDFFIDKEEDFIIRMQEASDSMKNLTDKKRLRQIRKAFTDLHGEMVLLLHWSLLNYTAVVKILKKHDKRSGLLLRQPLLASVLKQPFNSTDRITMFVKQAEEKSKQLLEIEEADAGESDKASTDSESVQSMREQQAELSRRTKAALDVWEEMRAKASTPSTVLPVTQKRSADEAEQPKTSVAAPPPAQNKKMWANTIAEQPAAQGAAKRQKVVTE